MALGQNYTPTEKRGRIVSLWLRNLCGNIHILSPFTQHLTEIVFNCKLPRSKESLFNEISTHIPMLEELRLEHPLRANELLPLVSNMPKLGNLAKLTLSFGAEILDNSESLSVLAKLQTCPLLTEICLGGKGIQVLEMPSALFHSLEPLLVNKLKVFAIELIILNSPAATALSHSLQSQHCNLICLILRNCCLLRNASKQLATGIGRNASLQRIAFHHCDLGSTDFDVLADALRGHKTLKEVDILQSSTAIEFDTATIQSLRQSNQNIAFQLIL